MSALHGLIQSLAEIIRLGAAFDMSKMSFEIDSDDVAADLEFGRS
jgi:hypothetical protein